MLSHAAGSWSCGRSNRVVASVIGEASSCPEEREPTPPASEPARLADRLVRDLDPAVHQVRLVDGHGIPRRDLRSARRSPRRRRCRARTTVAARSSNASESEQPAWVHSSENANTRASTCATATRPVGRSNARISLGDLGERPDPTNSTSGPHERRPAALERRDRAEHREDHEIGSSRPVETDHQREEAFEPLEEALGELTPTASASAMG